MKNVIILFIFLLLSLTSRAILSSTTSDIVIAENTQWSGKVQINEDITIADNATLTILAGTSIEFSGYYQINVVGTLIAKGTATDSIRFFVKDTTGFSDLYSLSGAWAGIRFNNSSGSGGANGVMSNNPISQFDYCKFQNAKAVDLGQSNYPNCGGAMLICAYSNVRINNSFFVNCKADKGGAIAIVNGSNPAFYRVTFYQNVARYGGGIYCEDNVIPVFTNCLITNNLASSLGGGIYCKNKAQTQLINALIVNNTSSRYGGGIYCDDYSDLKIINNTIAFNYAEMFGGGLYSKDNINISLYNSIIYSNSSTFEGSQIYTGTNNNFQVYCSDIQGGKEKFGGYTFVGTYYSCIDISPQFVKSSSGTGYKFDGLSANFSISDASTCANRATIDTTNLNLSTKDIANNQRIAGLRLDIGAYENQVAIASPDFMTQPEDLYLSAKTNVTHTETVKIFKVNVSNFTVSSLSGLDAPFSASVANDIITINLISKLSGTYKDTLLVNTNYGTKLIRISAHFGEIGDVSGSWGQDTVRIIGDVVIPENQTLIIEPNTCVKVEGYYGITVYGRVLIYGFENDSIRFTPQNFSTGWKGISFVNNNSIDSSLIQYCTFEGRQINPIAEKEAESGTIYLDNFSILRISNCTFLNNNADNGGAISCVNHSNPLIINSYFHSNTSTNGGGIYCDSSSPTLIHSYFQNNNASNGGALYLDNYSNPLIINTILNSNEASLCGGAMICQTYSTPTLVGCTLSKNQSIRGGAVYLDYSNPLFISNTVVYNYAQINGGGIYCGTISNPIFQNSILFYNKTASGLNQAYLSYDFDVASPFFYNCDVQGTYTSFTGDGASGRYDFSRCYKNNSNDIPSFLGKSSYPYRLNISSLCIDKGSNDFTSALYFPKTDFLNQPRIYNSKIDLGAFELNPNHNPYLNQNVSNKFALESHLFSYAIPYNTFKDNDLGDSLYYSVSAPSWLSFDSKTMVLKGTPSYENAGIYTLEISVTDDYGASTKTVFTITTFRMNTNPISTQVIGNQIAIEDSYFVYSFSTNLFYDKDNNDHLTYTISSLPNWLQFDAKTRTFSGTPHYSDIGSLDITITATDDSLATASIHFTIVVKNKNYAPLLKTPLSDLQVLENQSADFSVSNGTFIDNNTEDVLTYSVLFNGTKAFPTWLVYNSTTDIYTVKATNDNVGIYTIDVIATDNYGLSASDEFLIHLVDANSPPKLMQLIDTKEIVIDTEFVFTVPESTFIDTDKNDVLTYSSTLTNGKPLPKWLVFDSATRTFRGTPTSSELGFLSIQVIATDRALAATSTDFLLLINRNTDIQTINNQEILIFPNPTQDKIYVQIPNVASKKVEIRILNIAGLLLNTYTTFENQMQINLSNYSKGIYLLQINIDNQILTKKVILN